MESASDAEAQGIIDKLKVITEKVSDAEIDVKAQEIIDMLKVRESMESSAYDAEIDLKILEFIDILDVRKIMKILQVPYSLCFEHYRVFNEHMQNPRIAARVQREFDVKVQKITQDIQLAKEKLENSSFFEEFMRQTENPEMVARIERVIGTDSHHSELQLVLYGVGSLKVEHCQMQFALAILLREKFAWINNDIEVYDPIHSPLDRRVINELNCKSLHVNEECKRTVDKPTLFLMPHCPVFLYEHVLEANWTPDNLNKIIILGNSFKGDRYFVDWPKMTALCNTDHLIYEIPLPETSIKKASPAAPSNSSPRTHTVSSRDVDPVVRKAFKILSWHFFEWDVSLCNTASLVRSYDLTRDHSKPI